MKLLTLKINNERNDLINNLLFIASCLATVLLAASLFRIFNYGWQNVLFVHISGTVALWLITFLKKRISLTIKLIFIISLSYIIAITGVFNFGLLSESDTLFFLVFILATAFNKMRYGVFILISIGIVYTVFGILFTNGALHYTLDVQNYQESPYSWVLHILTFLVYGSFALLTIQSMNHVIIKNLKTLEQQRGELEKLNAAKDKVHGVIAHDLKRPFNNLLGIMQLMAGGTSKMTDERKDKIFEKLYRDSKGVYQLLENLLKWAESETGNATRENAEVRIHSLVTHAVVPYLSIAEQKGVLVEKLLADDLSVVSDGSILQIVLSNLINNAVKFTPCGGTITLAANENESHVEIKISDTGVGMNQETLSKIFDSQETLTTLGTDNEKGTGLGLGVCKELLTKIDCELQATSKEGSGSTFAVIIPKD